MTLLLNEKSWKWLANEKEKPESAFLQQLKLFLLADFTQAFELLKTQKLLSRSRSLNVVQASCADLAGWACTAPLSRKERIRLVRHCKVTAGLQTMMSALRDRIEPLSIWHLSYEDLAIIMVGSLEASDNAFQEQLGQQSQEASAPSLLNLNATKNWLMRGVLDNALLVLNEARKRCRDVSDFEVGDPKAFVASLQLAQETAEVMAAWDHYSFGRAELSVNGNTIKIHRSTPDRAVRSTNYRQRMMELDLAHRTSTRQQFFVLSEKIKAGLLASEMPETFNEFIASPLGEDILDQLLELTRLEERGILNRLDEYIDLDSELKLAKHKHTYRDLVKVWSYLMRVAVTSQIWGDLIQNTSGEYPSARLSLSTLKRTFNGLGKLSDEATDRALQYFSSFADQQSVLDLFYQPLLRLSEEDLLIPASYILTSRFDRNLISIAARDRSNSLAAKGRKPLLKLKWLFERAGYRCLEELQVRDANGQPLTDLDLLAYRDRDVFFFQSKVLAIPDSPYEHWRVDQTLLSAAAQMDIVMTHIDQVKEACKEAKPPFVIDDCRVTPYLITDVMVHSGFSLGGFQVIDFNYLEQLLDGDHLALVDVLTREVLQMMTRIAGEVPSPEEIKTLVSTLAAPRAARPRNTSKRSIAHAGWTLVVDAQGLG